MKSVTLQINLSPGDLNYAKQTVPELIKLHKGVDEIILIVDCCKPQSTKLVRAQNRFPEPEFSKKVIDIRNIANQFLKDGLVNCVYFLEPDSQLIEGLYKKYTNGIINVTHGYGATANVSYWAGIELAKSRYVIHFDADMLMYRDGEYKWWEEAIEYMSENKKFLFAIPRPAPPSSENITTPSFFVGPQIEEMEKYWIHNWFSTRYFIVDKRKFEPLLPLVKGKLRIELFLRKLLKRGWPLDPEIIFYKYFGIQLKRRRLVLKSEKAFVLHPLYKPERYYELLPSIMKSVKRGIVPELQKGFEDIDLDAWNDFFEKD